MLPEPDSIGWSFPFTEPDWEHTPPAVQASLHTLHDELGQLHERGERLEARLHQHSTTSSRLPSSDAPYKKPRRRMGSSTRSRKGGGQPGHLGHRQVLFAPTRVTELLPESGACGSGEFALIRPSSRHHVIALPPIEMEVTHWVLPQGRCVACGSWQTAQAPGAQGTGYGPRVSALMAEVAGTYGNGRRMGQTFCSSVLGVPRSLGAIQQVWDRVPPASDPYYPSIATPARQAPVHSMDATPWDGEHARAWLWVMAREQVAFSLSHPRRATAALCDLMDDWAGLLGSDGYGVSPRWVHARQTCVAHVLRPARGVAARPPPDLAACGAWALVEWPRVCQMAKAPPTGGTWRAWDAWLCTLINRYHARSDDAGRFARRVLREMASLWVLVAHHGVEPTNNRSEGRSVDQKPGLKLGGWVPR